MRRGEKRGVGGRGRRGKKKGVRQEAREGGRGRVGGRGGFE